MSTFSASPTTPTFELAKSRVKHSLLLLSALFAAVAGLAAVFLHGAASSEDITTIAILVETVLLSAFAAWTGLTLNVRGLERKPGADGVKPCPEQDATFLSQATFSWLNSLMRLGYARTLTLSDLPDVNPPERADDCIEAYATARRGTESLLGVIWRMHGALIMGQLALSLVGTLLFMASVYLFKWLLDVVPEVVGKKGDEGEWDGAWVAYLLVGGMFLASIARSMVESAASLLSSKIGIRIRTLLSALVYQKSLRRLPVAAGGKKKDGDENGSAPDPAASAGKIVNLMSVDANSVGDWIGLLPVPFILFTQIVLCAGGLFWVLGWPALPGVVVLFLVLMSGGPLTKYIQRGFFEIKTRRDARVSAFNEMLQGMRIVKLFAWEPEFRAQIGELRAKELEAFWNTCLLFTAGRMMWFSGPFVTTLFTLGVYTALAGKVLTATVAFTALSLFSFLRRPLQDFPDTIVQLMDAWVSLERIETFLKEPELEDFQEDDQIAAIYGSTGSKQDRGLGFSGNASFEWHEEEAAPSGAKPSAVPSGFTGFVKKTVQFSKNAWARLTGKQQVEETAPLVVEAAPEPEAVFGLSNLNVTFEAGKLTVVVGATGSGKSSLLLALLGEMKRTRGALHRPRNAPIAYVPQVAWLMNASIRDNILFGSPLDEARYRNVIRACALERDLEVLEGGDLTEVGEKGINLSGGQKQRIALARACYSKAQIVLLDDPLSAVDAPTAKHIMDECVTGILSDRTRVLVTNAAGLAIPRADVLLLIHNGQILKQGTVEHVLVELGSSTSTAINSPQISGSPLPSETPAVTMLVAAADRVQAVGSTSYVSIGTAFSDGLKDMADLILSERRRFLAGEFSPSPVSSSSSPPSEEDSSADGENKEKGKGKSGVLVSANAATKLVEEEKMEEGSVSLRVYLFYFQAAGGASYALLLLVAYILMQAAAFFMDVIVLWWCQAYETAAAAVFGASAAFSRVGYAAPLHADASLMPASFGFAFGAAGTNRTEARIAGGVDPVAARFIPLYAVMTVVVALVTGLRMLLMWYGINVSGRHIHAEMLDRLLGSPLRFFEVTPIGRIMNRFTKDIGNVDFDVGAAAGNMIYYVVFITCTVGAIALVIPQLLLFMIPIAYIYVLVGNYYLTSCRSLKRLESVSRSPIFSHFSETLYGVSLIRSFNAVKRFKKESRDKFNEFNRPFYYMVVASQWFALRIQVIGSLVILAAGFLLISANLGKSFTGLCLNFAMGLTDALIMLVKNQSWLEMRMNSVERCHEYIKLEQEAPPVIEETSPPPYWPTEGRIDIEDLRFRYAPDLPEVLKGLSVSVGAREKVGVVGRTGAGKSSLALALFRIVEPSGGRVVIDGVDVSEIGLADLRGGLTIIPQDPILFTGAVRSNLDPFGRHTDLELWEALKRSHLVSRDAELDRASSSSSSLVPNDLETHEEEKKDDKAGADKAEKPRAEVKINLDTPIAEGGSNLSAGQRQLLCLARALVKRTKVIVMDEATASVDTETDSRIQDTIRTEFSDCTVLTIAHRLKTIADYDRVLVLDHGDLIENGSPLELIEESKVGVFRKM
ncbi:hypothetical protein HDU96_002009 [Phlyctochytrium bullatum]|nr:hypothetical protein HDU96_002009 [Phlyctochytrium bullatum]